MSGIVLTPITDSETGVTRAVNLNFLTYIEWDAENSYYRIHFLDDTLTTKLNREDYLAFIDLTKLPNTRI